ncbi:MAG: molybdenum cofactor guanylyltransferase MobA [Albidovulum sp.]|nr:molybdenum cofactor guanylyltransferase MobA [Albidovulum sp.]MDE0531955.1 molybdenum cofactor guanylyltransferase MobA [Albidovulum sp.]
MASDKESFAGMRGKVAGVILAGGRARRMGGGDKSLLALGKGTILDSVVERLSAQVDPIALNANGDPSRFERVGLPVVPDSFPGRCGPLAGVLAGMEWAIEEGARHIVTVAADTPYFPRDLVARLLQASEIEGHPIALASSVHAEAGRKLHPTFGYWPVELRESLNSSLSQGIRKVIQWTDIHGVAIAEFANGEFDPFFNINTPEDLEFARRRELVGQVSDAQR